ncbi:MAG: CZB domain-containing protein, partial [Desulfovibrionaceae bacterium]
MTFSDIPLSRRIFLAFGTGITFIVIALLFISHNLTRIGTEADILNQPRQDASLLAAEVAHLAWANAVQAFLLNEAREPLKVAVDGHKCDFGKWFYGTGRKALENAVPATLPIMSKIENVHLRLHTSAVQIKKLAAEGHFQQANTVFEKESIPLLHEIQSLLRAAYTASTSSTSTTLVTLRDILSFTQTTAYSLCIIIALGGSLLAIRFTRSVTVPLNALVAYAKRISQGDFIPVPLRQKDEMGQLAKAFETMVQELKEKLGVAQGIMTGITVPFAVCNTQGILTYINQPMLNCWGRRGVPAEYIGVSCSVFYHDDPKRDTLFNRAMHEKQPCMDVSMTRTNFAGEQKHLQINVSPLWDLDKNLVGAFSLHNDLTETFLQQERITALNEHIVLSAAEARTISIRQAEAFNSLMAQLETTSNMAAEQGTASHQVTTSIHTMADALHEMAAKADQSMQSSEVASHEAADGAAVVQQTMACITQTAAQSSIVDKGIRQLDSHAAGIGRVLDL